MDAPWPPGEHRRSSEPGFPSGRASQSQGYLQRWSECRQNDGTHPFPWLCSFAFMLACIKIQTFQNQGYAIFTFEAAKITDWSALASRPAPRGVDSFSGPLGGRTLPIS